MEGWMISMAIALLGIVSSYAVMKSNVSKSIENDKKQNEDIALLNKFMNEMTPLLKHLSKAENEVVARANTMEKDIVALKMKMNQAPTMNEVRADFVSKEIFIQMEKHMDEKFKGLSDGIETIIKNQEKRLEVKS